MGMFDKMAKKMMESAIQVAGPLLGDLTGGSAAEITDPVEGWGTVAEVQVVDGYAHTYVRPLAMVVEIPGHEPYAAQPMTSFPREKMPQKGQRLPLLVDRADPTRIVVRWDDVATGLDEVLRQARGAAPSATAGADDVVAQLERLGKLRESGAITDEELAVLKARLLGG